MSRAHAYNKFHTFNAYFVSFIEAGISYKIIVIKFKSALYKIKVFKITTSFVYFIKVNLL